MSLKSDSGPADRRRHYRVTSGLEVLVTAALALEGGGVVPAELVDLSASGACLRWPLATTPVLDLNDTVQLIFQATGGAAPLTIQAVVRWMGGGAGFVRYGLEFCDSGDPDAAGDAALWGLFNRRRTQRG